MHIRTTQVAKQMDGLLQTAYSRLRDIVSARDRSTLPNFFTLQGGIASLPQPGAAEYLVGRDFGPTLHHILKDIVPSLNGQALTGRYYGFVTGGTLPIAEAADNIVSALDQNVQVHLPDETISTVVEDAALKMLLDVLNLGTPDEWSGRTTTTGATASNILGLACGREAVIERRLPEGSAGVTVAEAGLLGACAAAGIKEIQVLTSMGHSSLSKAASIVGLGHSAVKELPASQDEPWRIDIDAVERELQRENVANIIAISAGEVNTGRFATGALDMPKLRSLADRHGAWIHVDGAFGIFARALPDIDEFLALRTVAAGLDLADSITVDGHKLLNVPYETGYFFTRNVDILTQVCSNPNAPYLSSNAASQIQSPLNVGLENSRRFRALPTYAVLVSEGRAGIAEMLARMVRLARGVAAFIQTSEDYELLPEADPLLEGTNVIVLFRAKDDGLNEVLAQKIKATRQIYVSGTKWKGQKACRLAVGSWRVEVAKDLAVVEQVLTEVAKGHANR